MFDGSIGTTRRARRGMLREWRLHALSVFSLAVAFVCLGAALLVLTNLRAIEERWAHAGRASIYLKDNAQAQDVESLKLALTTADVDLPAGVHEIAVRAVEPSTVALRFEALAERLPGPLQQQHVAGGEFGLRRPQVLARALHR